MNDPLDFPAGSTLTVIRPTDTPYDKHGDRQAVTVSHTIGPCSIVDSHGQVNHADDGTAKWVGTIDVEAPPGTDVTIHDRIRLPNGDVAVVIRPPERPRNPFTGWEPFVKFTLTAPGTTPALGEG
jgi:hypothetical protein